MKIIAGAMLALGLFACSKGDDVKVAEPPVVRHHAAADAEFAFNADEFARAFNTASRSFHQSFHLDRMDVRHGAVHDYIQQNVASGIELTAAVSKDTGRIINVTALVSGDNANGADNHKLMAISEVIAIATNPDLSQKKATALVDDMMREAAGPHQAGQFPQRFLHHVRYVLRSDSGIGSWWIATPT